MTKTEKITKYITYGIFNSVLILSIYFGFYKGDENIANVAYALCVFHSLSALLLFDNICQPAVQKYAQDEHSHLINSEFNFILDFLVCTALIYLGHIWLCIFFFLGTLGALNYKRELKRYKSKNTK